MSTKFSTTIEGKDRNTDPTRNTGTCCLSLESLLSRIRQGKPPFWFVLCIPVLVNMLFGFYPVLIKLFANGSGEKANAFVLTFYRNAGAVPVLFLFSFWIEGVQKLPDKGSLMKFALLGMFGMLIGQMTYINGVYLVGPDVTSAMQPLVAVWTPIISMLFCVEKVPSLRKLHTYLKFFGIFAAVGGAAKIILSTSSVEPASREVSTWKQFFGCLCVLTDTISGGIYFTLQKKLIHNQPSCEWRNYPIAVTGYSYFFGAIYMGVAVSYYLFTGQAGQFVLPRHTLPVLVYAIVFVSAATYFMITWSNKYIPSSLMTAFWPVQVVATVTAAYIVFGDELSSEQYIGAIFIFMGLAFVLYSNYLASREAED